jgi:hypothetical protein
MYDPAWSSIVLYQTMIHLFAFEEKQWRRSAKPSLRIGEPKLRCQCIQLSLCRGDPRGFSTFKLSTLAPSLPGRPNAETLIDPAGGPVDTHSA